jgi:LemA protein
MKLLSIITLSLFISSCGIQSIPTALNEVDANWAEVQNQYKRRSDLIPNLVEVVKGYAKHEKETLEGVISARAKATSVNFTADQLTDENMKKFQAAQGNLSSALSRLMVTVEKYPDLKANQNFLDLQGQLEGTENRITVARNQIY